MSETSNVKNDFSNEKHSQTESRSDRDEIVQHENEPRSTLKRQNTDEEFQAKKQKLSTEKSQTTDHWEIPVDGLELFTSKGVVSKEKVNINNRNYSRCLQCFIARSYSCLIDCCFRYGWHTDSNQIRKSSSNR